jgi:intraflagellar transport protein 88
MMDNENEGDLYEGYNDFNSALDTQNLAYDQQFQQAVLKTSHGRRPPPVSVSI